MSRLEAKVSPYAGLKASCRHITTQEAVTDKIRFVAGTAVVGKTNQIQIIEYDDFNGGIQCIQSLEHQDEIRWIACHPTEEDLLLTISQNYTSRNTSTNLYRLPPPISATQNQTHQPMELVSTFEIPEPQATRIFFLPAKPEESNDKFIISGKSTLNLFDINDNTKPILSQNISEAGQINAAAADPLHKNSIGLCVGRDVQLWDLRAGESVHVIKDAHVPAALDIAFNESKPWWVCTGGSDGMLRCWDLRDASPKCEYRASSHWVTRAVPSTSHEQLILTAGTDSKARVFNSLTFAFQREGKLKDGELIKSIRHDDSVYCAAWAAGNPWVFASVSYKGQINICQLPSEIVDTILMGDSDSD